MPTATRFDTLEQLVRDVGEYRAPAHPQAFIQRSLNRAIGELRTLLTDLDVARYRSQASIAIVSGTAEYDIATDAADFYLALQVEMDEASNPSGFRTMGRVQFDDINDYQTYGGGKRGALYCIWGGKLIIVPKPTYSGTARLTYVGSHTELSAAGDTIDTVNHWDNYLVYKAAIKCAQREQDFDAADDYRKELIALTRLISRGATVDQGEPPTMTDAYGGRRARHWQRRGRYRYGDGGS